MKSIFKIISASIRKKKGISVAIVLTALIAGLLLSYSATLFYNVADFYADKIDELGTAHNIYALGEADRDCVPKLVRWLKNDERIEKAASFDSLYCTGEMQVPDGNVIAQVFYFAPMNQDTEIRLCVPLTDTISDSGIYLPESMKSYGFTEGSDFKYMMDNKTYTYTVTGFVDATCYTSSMYGSFIAFLPEKLYNELSESDITSVARMTIIASRIIDLSQSAEIHADFYTYAKEQNISMFYSELPYHIQVRCAADTLRSVLGFVVGVAVVIVFVLLLLIGYNVSIAIDDSMERSGTLISIGYTSLQLRAAYAGEYILLIVPSAIAGVALSYLALHLSAPLLTQLCGTVWSNPAHFGLDALCVGFILLTTLIVCLMVTRKLKKLTPVAAFRHGRAAHSFERNALPLDKTPLPLQTKLGLKHSLNSLGQNLVTVLIIAAITATAAMGVLVYYNLVIDDTTFKNIMGQEICDAAVFTHPGADRDKIKEKINTLDGVDYSLYFDVAILSIDASVTTCAVENLEKTRTLRAYEGRMARYDYEVVIGAGIADRLKLSVGDSLELSGGGNTQEYLVTGILQTMLNGGEYIYMTTDGLERLTEGQVTLEVSNASAIYVYSDGSITGKELVEKLEKQLPSDDISVIQDTEKSYREFSSTFSTIFTIFSTMILIVSLAVAVLMLSILIRQTLARRRSDYGTMMALGYSVSQLRRQTMWSMLPAVIIGATLGAFALSFTIEPLLTTVLKAFGVYNISFDAPTAIIIAIIMSISVFSAFAIIACAGSIKNISAYSLINE